LVGLGHLVEYNVHAVATEALVKKVVFTLETAQSYVTLGKIRFVQSARLRRARPLRGRGAPKSAGHGTRPSAASDGIGRPRGCEQQVTVKADEPRERTDRTQVMRTTESWRMVLVDAPDEVVWRPPADPGA
jgi:hypothetical protein